MTTTKQRILTALRGGMPDHLPWAPRWELWFDAVSRDGRLPEKYRGWHIFDVARDLGLGIKGNRAPLYRTEMTDVQVVVRERRTPRGREEITEYRTPKGDIGKVYFVPPELEAQGVAGRVSEPVIKTVRDYDIACFVVEHTRIIPTYDELETYTKLVGDDGLAFPNLGSCPMHRFMREFTTYEQSYYEMYDHPNEVDRLVQVLEEQEWEIVRIALEAPIETAEIDGNYDAELTPPPLYRKHFVPFLKRVADAFHARGKLLMTHVDGDNSGLLELIKETGFDIGEAWTPAPMTPVTTAEARRVWGGQISIWGGLPTTVLTASFPEREFDRYFAQLLLEIAPGNGFVLGTGDNIPTDSSWERINHITELVAEFGKLPVDVERLRALTEE